MLPLPSSFFDHLLAYPSPHTVDMADTRRWKRPKKTARSSQWSSASERYVPVHGFFLQYDACYTTMFTLRSSGVVAHSFELRQSIVGQLPRLPSAISPFGLSYSEMLLTPCLKPTRQAS